MGNMSWLIVVALLLKASLPAQTQPDFSGRWLLESPSPAPSGVPRTLSVRQVLVSRNVRGEPMTPFFKDITIEREVDGQKGSETHTIGVVGGAVDGITADGKGGGGARDYAVRWDANSLVFESRSYTGPPAGTRVRAERREVWWLDSDDRLHVVITTRSSVQAPGTMALVYRRP